jgi:Zn-dependent protease
MWWVERLLALPNGHVILASWIVWVLGSIVLHELAHGWAALWAGDDTPVRTGHMTWNPLVHMGMPSLIMFAIIGIAWGMMPVNPSRFRGRYDDAIVSIAGPAMNLLLAAAALIAWTLWIGLAGGHWLGISVGQPLYGNVQMFLHTGVMLNIVLCIFNMLPVPPLDGARILSSFSEGFRRMWETQQAQFFALIAFVGLFIFAGPRIFRFARQMADESIRAITSVVAPGAF